MSNFGDPSSTFGAVKLGVSKAEIVSASSIDTLQEFFDVNVKSLSDETPGKLQSDDDSGGCYQSDFEMDASEPRTPPTPEKAGENEGMRRTDASGEPAKQQAQLHRFEGKTHPLLLTQNILRQSKIYGSSKAASKNHIPKSSSSKKSQKHENIFSRQGSFADNKRVKKSSSFAGLQSKETSTVDQEVDRKAKKQMKKHSQSLGSLSNIDQLAKLQTQVDSLKSLLKEKEEEIKTLKIVNRRQDIAIRNNDKTQVEIPRQYQYQTEELRVLKQTHSHCLQKISSAEKSSQEHIEETIRLKDTIAKMSVLIKSRLGDSGDAMQSEIERLRKELAEKDIIIQESAHFHDLEKKFKFSESVNNLAVREVRTKNAKLVKDLEDAKAYSKQLSEKLEEKTRQIAAKTIQSSLHSIHSSTVHRDSVRTNSKSPSTHINPQQSLHKPLLQKMNNLHHTETNKPNNDTLIRSWNLSKESVDSNIASLDQIRDRLKILEESEESPIAIVARRFLFMQLSSMETADSTISGDDLKFFRS